MLQMQYRKCIMCQYLDNFLVLLDTSVANECSGKTSMLMYELTPRQIHHLRWTANPNRPVIVLLWINFKINN